MGMNKSPLLAWMTPKRYAKAKELHCKKKYGRREIQSALDCPFDLSCWIRKQSWYDPTKGSPSNTISKKHPWKKIEKERETRRKSKRTHRTSDLPLFQHAAKMRAQGTPRTELSKDQLLHVRGIEKTRYHTDPNFYLRNNLRKRLNRFVTRERRVRGFEERCGCTTDQLRRWLEYQFDPGMSWETKGRWHIDHIVPCSLFDLTDPNQQFICFNWRNLQPMWGSANISKGNNLNEAFRAMREHPNKAAMCELKAMIGALPQFKISA